MMTSNSINKTWSTLNFVKCLPFIGLHLFTLTAVFFIKPNANVLILGLVLYIVRMFAITGGYHRYFSHRTYKTNRIFQFMLAVLGSTAVQKGVLWWAANHRHHHRHSDQAEDLHSPKQNGFWWSHLGWILSPSYEGTMWKLIPDLAKYPELVFINKYHLIPVIALGAFTYWGWGMPGLIWGFFVSTIFVLHCTFFINSLSHVWGTRRYQTTDTSRNNWVLAILTLGEGWHNNHHCYQNSTRQGFFWWEWDPTYYVLRAMSCIGIVWGIKEPPILQLAARFGNNHQKTI